jgi:hypothetical protein
MSSLFKGMGYLVSTFSVVLLGIVAWQGASENRLLMLCLAAGMATSVLGMTLRWISHRIDQKEKNRIAQQSVHPEAQD